MADISTEFNQNRKTYKFSANIQVEDSNKLIVLANEDISEFQYVNDINQLFLTASITFIDKNGKIDPVLHSSNSFCEITFIETDDKSNKQTFKHTFLINDVEILKRSHNTISYKLELFSINYYFCENIIHYSTYKFEQKPILTIFKDCLNQCGLIPVKEFNDKLSDVKINYITNGNDNILSIQKFLFSRLFYFSERDESIKFLLYDEFNNTYNVYDTVILEQIKNNKIWAIKFSFFENMQDENTPFKNLDFLSKSTIYKTLYSQNLYNFDYSTNSFNTISNINRETIVNYLNSTLDQNIYKSKFKLFAKNYNIENRIYHDSFWNKTIESIYQSALNILINDGSLVINTIGELTRQPLQFVNLITDRNSSKVNLDANKSDVKEIKNSYQTFDGPWIISKVRNIIYPNKQKYLQNICIFRNYKSKKT